MATAALSALFAFGGLGPVSAGGDTRTISLYHIHTGESLTITYKQDGHYIPSAMKKINYLLRDWRKDDTTTIDPRTIDLVWELHEDLGSHEPIHIVCGFRSAATNAFLHRIGRHVAKESQHIEGRAIDFYFPDVPTVKIRNVALVRQVGGVGYYRSAGGPTGFLHVDSGHVRHWGPEISNSQMAAIFSEGKRLLGKRMRLNGSSSSGDTQVASADDGQAPIGPLGRLFGWMKHKPAAPAAAPTPVAPVQVAEAAPKKQKDTSADDGDKASQADMADLSADAATPPKPAKPKAAVSQEQMASLGDLSLDASEKPASKAKPAPAPVAADVADNADSQPDQADAAAKPGRVIPKPRMKPVGVMMAAAANMKPAPEVIRINAASAPPPSQTGHDAPSPVANSLGTLMAVASAEPAQPAHAAPGKSNLGLELRNGTAKGVPVIKPMLASAGSLDMNWWPKLALHRDEAIRRDGQPALIGTVEDDVMPKAATLTPATAGGAIAATPAPAQVVAEGKGDLTVNEADKVDLN